MAAMKDVARLAGVSVSTVSRVLNNRDLVEESTSRRVDEAIRKLNYKPNLLAKGLREKSGRLVGLIVPESAAETFAQFVYHISDYCGSKGYDLLIGSHHNNPAREEELIRNMYRRNIDGLILSLASNESRALSVIQNSSVPTVIIDRVIHMTTQPRVVLDNRMAGRLVGDLFNSLGHKNVACVTGPKMLELTNERTEGFLSALSENCINMSVSSMAEGDFGYESGAAAAEKIFGSPENRPTAVWAQNDYMAAGVISWLFSHGLRVPEDVSVAGMDDANIASMLHPQITTVSQPFREMARAAVDIILRIKDGEEGSAGEKGLSYVAGPALVVRNSTGRAPE